MSVRLRHTRNGPCQLCAAKAATLHPVLRKWWVFIISISPEAHISWAFRDKDTQNLFFAEGKTKCLWPNSKHNKMKEGKPCAEAFDLFKLNADGVAVFPSGRFDQFYEHIWRELQLAGAPIAWSGNWKGFKERNHFELEE